MAASVCVSSLPLPSLLPLPHAQSPSLLLSLAAPAVMSGCSQVKSYYRSEEFSITPHPIKAQLACERFRRLRRGGKKNFFESNLTNTALIEGCAFCANVFTPCSVFNAVRKKKVLGLYFSNTLKRKAHPMEEPPAILRSPLPGGQAIKPCPQCREKR